MKPLSDSIFKQPAIANNSSPRLLFSPPPGLNRSGGEGSGVGGASAYALPEEQTDRPPTPDPSPPLRGRRGEEKCAAHG